MFSCDCCGCCCRNLKKSELYAQLDRGDGTCIYLKENLSKNKVILPIKKGKYVYEFPINTISKYNLKLNDKIKVTE